MKRQRAPTRRLAQRVVRTFLAAACVALLISWNFTIRVQASAGDLDPGFGDGGKVTTDFGGLLAGVSDLVIQPDGKLVAAGGCDFGEYVKPALARYNTDGSLDVTFGSSGQVITNLNLNPWTTAILSDGRIIVAGSSVRETRSDFALVCYNPDGSLDTSFGTGGVVLTDFFGRDDIVHSIAIQSDGRIVAAGKARSEENGWADEYFHFALARYNPDGILDTTFGVGGKVTPRKRDIDEWLEKVVIQPDGRIVAAGTSVEDGFVIYRYNSNGKLDRSFGSNGKVIIDFPGSASHAYAVDLILTDENQILAIGAGPYSETQYVITRYALVRYNSDGSPDTSFGSGGRITTQAAIDEIVLQPDGRIVAGVQGDEDFGLVRYNNDGGLDVTFGSGGQIRTNFGFDEWISAIAITPHGRLVAAGSSYRYPEYMVFALACYENDLETAPQIAGAEVVGKKLFIYGANFGQGAKIYLDGEKQKTANDETNPATTLIGKKAGKKIARGENAMLRVKNSDGRLSNRLMFTRPAP